MADLKTQLIDDLDKGRQKMLEVVAIAEEDQKIYPPWKIKEVIAHITGWDDAVLATLKSHSAGEVPAVPASRGIDLYNAGTVTERETLSYDLILKEWKTTRELVKTAIREMPEEKLLEPMVFPWGPKGRVDQLVAVFAEHEEEHAKEIMNILKAA